VTDRRPRLRWLIVALAALATVAGCAEVPVSGPLQSTKLPATIGGQQQGTLCCAQIMSPPKPGWSPSLIVQNFILASADFTDGHAVARQYLTASADSSWQPGPGPAVTVIAGAPDVSLALPPQLNSPKSEVVEITARELGAVDSTGQYIPAPEGQKPLAQRFGLKLVGHQWRIDSLPGSGRVSRVLLLSKDFFQLAYQPRNLYYFDPAYKSLVPDPVFLPVNTANPATVLVNALLAEPQGWLEGAAYSGFPVGSRSVRVQIPPGSKTAIVDLSMPKTAATRSTLAEMSAQLVWTLTSTSYGSRTIQAVKLQVNGRAWTPPGSGSPVQDRADYPQPYLQPPSSHQSLYFLTTAGAARVLPAHSNSSQPVPGQAGTSQLPLSSIAVAPDQHYLAGTSPAAGGTVYVSDLAAAAQPHASQSARALHVRLTGMSVSAASWDRQDDLWVAGSSHGRPAVRMLPGGGGAPVIVTLPPGIQQITAFRVAPDGVRVALIVSTRSGPRVLLAAVVRSGDQVTLASAGQLGADLAQPVSLSWYDADHLLVVDQADSGPQLFEVPVNGDRSTFQSIEPGMISIAAAGPHNDLFASLSTGQLVWSVGLGELWSSKPLPGQDATYPG
jgi:Lipoprotein LpqB beta-propeller domain/Sporulation and spore germination